MPTPEEILPPKLNTLAELINKGNISQAEREFETWKNSPGTKKADIAPGHLLFANFFFMLWNVDRALEHYASAESLDEGDPTLRAAVAAGRGSVHLQQGDFRKALQYFDQAEPILREAGDGVTPIAMRLGQFAAYEGLGRMDDAAVAAQECLVEGRETLPRETLVRLALFMSQTYLRRGDLSAALRASDDLFQLAVESNRSEALRALAIQAECWAGLGNLDRTIEVIRSAFSQAQSAEERHGIMDSLLAKEDLFSSSDSTLRLLDVLAELMKLPDDLRHFCTCLEKRARTLISLGRHDEALARLPEHRRLCLQQKDWAGVCTSTELMLEATSALGRPREVEALETQAAMTWHARFQVESADGQVVRQYLEKALDHARKQPNSKVTGDILFALGLTNLGENHDHAARCFEEALTIRQSLEDRRGVAFCHLNLASIQESRGNFDAMLTYAEAALAIADQLQDHEIGASVYHYRGVAQLHRDNLAESEKSYERALDLARRTGFDQLIGRAYYELALALQQNGKRRESQQRLMESIGPLRRAKGDGWGLNPALLMIARDSFNTHPGRAEQICRIANRERNGRQDEEMQLVWRELEELLAAMRDDPRYEEGAPKWLVKHKYGRAILPLDQQSFSMQAASGDLIPMLAAAKDDEERKNIRDRLRETSEAERSRSTHASAYFILAASIGRHRPFALYLRNFEMETSPTFFKGGTVVVNKKGVDYSEEEAIVNCLAPFLPVITLGNYYDPFDSLGGIPRFEVGGDWERVVTELIRTAQMVLLRCDSYTPGISREIQMIRRLRRTDSTILIQDRPDQSDRESDEEDDLVMKIVEKVTMEQTGGLRPKSKPAAMPADLGFKKSIWSDQIPESALDHNLLRPLILNALGPEFPVRESPGLDGPDHQDRRSSTP